MNRAERRRKVREINTPKKIEAYSSELERRLRIEYEEKCKREIADFIRRYTVLMDYVLDYELEREETIRVAARKSKNMSPKITEAILKIKEGVKKQLKYLEDGDFTIEDIEKYFREERGIDWRW